MVEGFHHCRFLIYFISLNGISFIVSFPLICKKINVGDDNYASLSLFQVFIIYLVVTFLFKYTRTLGFMYFT